MSAPFSLPPRQSAAPPRFQRLLLIAKLEFFAGMTKIGLDDTTAPYGVSWAVPAGAASYSLAARATDNLGAVTVDGGRHHDNGVGLDAVQRPCANPSVFAGPNFNSGNLGTAATCHQTTANLTGGNCGNFSGTRSSGSTALR